MPAWSKLYKLGHSRVLKSSYLWLIVVPVVAKLLVKAQTVEIPLGEGPPLVLSLTLPFSWSLLYFGAVAVSLATFVYSIRCPSIVRDYTDFRQFRDAGRMDSHLTSALLEVTRRLGETRQLQVLREFIQTFGKTPMGHRTQEEIDRMDPDLADRDGLRRMLEGITLRQDANANIQHAFWYVWKNADDASPAWRGICTTLYALGFLAGAIILFQNFVFVVRTVL